jgi:3-oxoacyl-[acyl-carrier protein] reductase
MKNTSTKSAIVTGASRGIGSAIAERLARDGFSVVVNYSGSEAEASAVAKKIKAGGGRAITAQADVSKPAEVARVFDAAEKEFGSVDVLVNNAGIMSYRASLLRMTRCLTAWLP